MRQAVGDLAGTPLCLFLLERVDQLDGREEPNPLVMMLDSLDTNGRGDMRFARAGAADQDDVVGVCLLYTSDAADEVRRV